MLCRFFVILITLFFFHGCSAEEQKPPQSNAPKIVKILDLNTSAAHTRSSEFPAEIYAFKDATMAFEVPGRIVAFNVQEGERVQKGTVLALLDDTLFQANYASALANYTQAQADYTRYAALHEARGVSQADLEHAKQALEVTKAQYHVAQKNLADTQLVAEFDGIVARKLVDDFARIGAKQPILRLQDNSALKVKFFAPEKEVVALKTELTPYALSKQIDFYVFLSDLPGEVFQATLLDLSTTAEKITRTFEVTLAIEPKTKVNLLPGMSARVRAVAKEAQPDTLLIPFSALFTDASNTPFVWKVNADSQVEKQSVILGAPVKDQIQVLQGLSPNDRIVTSGIEFLNPNDLVAPYKKIGK